MDWLRRFDWESRLRRFEAVGAGLGLLLVVLTLTPQAASALGPWLWVAVVVGLGLLIINSIAILWGPATVLVSWLGERSPIEIRVARKNRIVAVLDQTERGFLDFELSTMQGLSAANTLLDRISAEMARNTRELERSTPRLMALAGAPVDKRIRGAKKAADSIGAHGSRLRKLEVAYRAACQRMTTNFLHWVRTAPEGNDFGLLDNQLSELGKIMKGSRAATTSYRKALQDNRAMKVSQDVNRAFDQVVVVVDNLLQDVDGLVKFCVDGRVAIRKRSAKS